MIEGPPSFSPEAERLEQMVSRETVITSLREHPEDLSTLQRFLERREQEMKTSADSLALVVETAKLYQEAGLLDAAFDTYNDAIEIAWQLGDETRQAELEKASYLSIRG